MDQDNSFLNNVASKARQVVDLFVFKLRRFYKIGFSRFMFHLTTLYNRAHLSEIPFFFKFFIGRYSPKQFNLRNVGENLRVLFRMSSKDWLASTRDGKLILLKTRLEKCIFSLKDAVFFGALQKRVEKVVLYTYLTITLELNNPFSKKNLLLFLNKKISLLERLLNYVKKLNGKVWDQTTIKIHIDVYRRNSLFQAEVIRTMRLAVKRQKKSPLIKEAQEAIKKGLYPVLVTVGVSGSYWIRGVDKRIIGLFKPFDEEIHAPNNPVGPLFRGSLGLRKTRMGCRVGESPHHEVGAFLVDEFFGFGIVPRTCYAAFTHHNFFLAREDRISTRRIVKTKLGSFQEFVGGFVSLEKLSKEEIDSIPLDEFQLLIVLDVIIGNTDRNIGNILFGDEKIAAIDHGLSFPDRIDDFSYWYWSAFAQGEKPFFQPIMDLLNNFPYEELSNRLKCRCFISLNALQRMRERVALFTEAINMGLVPSQLKELFTYEYLHPLRERKDSLKEKAVEQALLYKKST